MAFRLSGWRPGTAGDGNDESQLYAIPPRDGNPDENLQDNCGPTCVSMILYWAQNILVSPDEIKDAILGQGVVSYTYVSQLSDYLNSRGITTHWEHIPDADAALATYRSWVEQDTPVIILTYSTWATKSGGHFVLGTGDNDDGGVHVSNPWTGGEEDWTPAMWRAAYNGYLLWAQCGPLPAGPYNSPSDGPIPPPPPTIGTGRPGRVQVLVDMTLRRTPTLDKSPSNVFFLPSGQPQLCYHGAVLQSTGRFTPHFREVTAGTHVGWLYVGDDPNHWTNLRAV